MELATLEGKISNEIFESLSSRGIKTLTPPQAEAVKKGLLEGKHIVVSSPTASGKTIIAEIACVNAILSKYKKALYVAPMRALVTEKYMEFVSAYPYIRTTISIGDLDSNDNYLEEYQMIFLSTEKLDSLIRHTASWVDKVGCIIFDEVHMIDDVSRGPTMELLITKLSENSSAQIIALSATIGNAKELAQWLSAKLVVSEYRPVKLTKGIINSNNVYYFEEDKIEETPRPIALDSNSDSEELCSIEDTLKKNKQILIFYSTRRNAEAGAARAAKVVESFLSKNEKEILQNMASEVLNTLQNPTEQCEKSSSLIKKGVAFHHAGLLNAQRKIIEDAFKKNLIKCICATTTLGLGVNLPAHTVLIKDTSRYGDHGNERLDSNVVMQLMGRAGRPQYDTEGRALIMARQKSDIMVMYERYLCSDPEPIYSKLGTMPALRSHILSFIAEEFINDPKKVKQFLTKSFYGFQYGRERQMGDIVDSVFEELERWEFIEPSKIGYIATKIGARVSELYIDPLSARWIIECLNNNLTTIDVLFMMSSTIEMRPYVRISADVTEQYALYMQDNEWIEQNYIYKEEEFGSYDPEAAFATALMLNDWMEEIPENILVKKYRTTPGALYTKLSNGDWIVYSCSEIAKILKKPVSSIINTRIRLRYGIKQELMDLVRLQHIGRVRARILYNKEIKSVSDMRINKDKVSSLLGEEITNKVFKDNDL